MNLTKIYEFNLEDVNCSGYVTSDNPAADRDFINNLCQLYNTLYHDLLFKPSITRPIVSSAICDPTKPLNMTITVSLVPNYTITKQELYVIMERVRNSFFPWAAMVTQTRFDSVIEIIFNGGVITNEVNTGYSCSRVQSGLLPQ